MIFNPVIVKGGAKRYKITSELLTELPSEAEAGTYVTGVSLGPLPAGMGIADAKGNSVPYNMTADGYNRIVTFVMPASDVTIATGIIT